MNFLKSVFISGFITWLVVVSNYSGMHLIQGTEPVLSWLGLALAALPPLIFFIKAFLFKTPRTPRHPVGYSVVSSLGLAMTLAMSYRYGPAGGIIHIWAGSTLIAWFAYLRWYSVLDRSGANHLGVGAPLPTFQLEDTDTSTVSSESFRGKPHLLLFHRGNWCPFCTAQITELAAAYRRLEALDIAVVLISPQSVAKNSNLAARFDVPMKVLRDPHNAAAKKLGILQAWGTPMGMQMLGYESDTVLPTIVVTDAEGNIVFTDQTDNYRIRPEPEVFETILADKLTQNTNTD